MALSYSQAIGEEGGEEWRGRDRVMPKFTIFLSGFFVQFPGGRLFSNNYC